MRRQVTVEFTLPEPLHDELRIGPDGPWCVPIALLEKQPLRHFDLLEDDEWRPILGREHNGPIASALVLAAARLAIDSETVDSEVRLQLHRIALGDPPDARAALAVLRGRAHHEQEVRTILDHDTSGYFVETFAESYMLIALLPSPFGRRILKYSYDEHLRFIRGRPGRARRLAGRLGWSPLVIDIAVPTAAHTASYHAEVVVPEELRIDAVVRDGVTNKLLSSDIERGVDRASLHAPGVALDADPLLKVAVSAERSGVPTLAFVISAVTALLLLLGAAVGRLGLTDGRLVGGGAARGLGAVRGDRRPRRRAPARARDLRRPALAAVDHRDRRAGGGGQRRVRRLPRRARHDLVRRRWRRRAGLSRPRDSIHASRAAEAQARRARHRRQDVTMTFSKLTAFVARDRRLPPSGWPPASLFVPSAEHRNLAGVRAPKPITPEQAKWLREQRAA